MSHSAPGDVWAIAWVESLKDRTDAGRWRRGVRYFEDERVLDLKILPGSLLGSVEGSYGNLYDVEIQAPLIRETPVLRILHFLLDDAGIMAEVLRLVPGLMPSSDHLTFACSCPDSGEPCKHGVALWLEAAEAIARQPESLLQFRGIGQDHPGISEPAKKPVARPATKPTSSQAKSAELPGEDVRAFWEGDKAELGRLYAEVNREKAIPAPPLWVFQPPVSWPERGMPYAEVMQELYRRIRKGADSNDV